jgi:hypothetical protein
MGFLLGAFPAEASLMTFTSRTAFEAATTGLTTITFEGIVPTDSAQDFPNPDGLMTDGVTFRTSGTGPSGPGFVTVYGAALAAEQSDVLNTGTGAILVWAPPDQPGTAFLDVWLPPQKTAFATDLWAQQPFVATVRAIVNSGEATENFDTTTTDRPTSSFFGVTSDANTILLVRFEIPPGQVGLILDNLSVATADDNINPIPEPGTMMLLCAGLAGLLVFRRCRT